MQMEKERTYFGLNLEQSIIANAIVSRAIV